MDRRTFLTTGLAFSAGAVVTAAGASPWGGDLAAAVAAPGRRRGLPWDHLSSPTPTTDDHKAAVDWARGGFRAVDAHSNGHTYVGHPDTELSNWEWAYYGTNYPRLLEVKRAYDPHRFFRFAQSVGAR
jgi:hypothetical protein